MLITNVTHLRGELPSYLRLVQKGEHILITSHGKPIARILPVQDVQQEAKLQLAQLQAISTMTDVVSPISVEWDTDDL